MIKKGNSKAPFVKGKAKPSVKSITITDDEAIRKYEKPYS